MAYRLFEKRFDYKFRIIAATPLISLLIFLVLGFAFNLWHPGWVVFLLIPTMPFILGIKKITISFSLLCFVIYIVIGIIWNLWHPGWIIFLLVPILNILFPTQFKQKRKVDRIIIDQDDVE